MSRLLVLLSISRSSCLAFVGFAWLASAASASVGGVFPFTSTTGDSFLQFTPTPTPTGIVTPIPQVCVVIQGSISMTDPIQIGMLNHVGTPSVCQGPPRPDPGQADTLERHRDIYVYRFPFGSFSSQCVTVNLTPTGCPGNLFSVAYVNGGYAGDLGKVPSNGGQYSFTVYRGQTFSVVVHEVTPQTGCSDYTLTLSSNIPCIYFTESPTPTPTSTPNMTQTRTPTSTTTTTPTCCNAVSGTISSYCDGSPQPYRYTYGLTNNCIMTTTGAGGLFFEVSPNSTGPWTSPLHVDYFGHPVPPGYTEYSGSMWSGPLPPGNNWFRHRLYLSGSCWVVNVTSAPQPACVGGTITPVTATRTPTSLLSTHTPVPLTHTPTVTSTAIPTCVPEWRVQSNPGIGSAASLLKAVAAVRDIWAAGTKGGSSNLNETLIEHWAGVVWSVVPSPNVASSHNNLEGLAAVATDDVWAVGYSYDGSVSRTLIMHWNGSAWSISPSPNVGLNVNMLAAVTAIAADDVWAVGYSSTGGGTTRTLILHWDGSQWDDIPSPNTASGYDVLYGVDARASDDIWAVGSGPYDVNTGIGYALILHWDGVLWSIIPSPRPGVASFLQDVTVVDSSDVWAVGSYREGGERPYSLSLILHWNGTDWSVVPSPSPGAVHNYLWGVAALSSGDVWAVGEVDRRTFTLRWNGVQWAIVASPNIGISSNNLQDVAPVISSDVWAVGDYFSVPEQTSRALVERYTDPCICYTQFTDVPRDSTFYPLVRCLACLGVVSGYVDGTFRPNNEVTRGQLAKIVSNAAGFNESVTGQTFEDVPPSSTFYVWIERLTRRGHMTGYTCGGVGEPCVNNRPYFRPAANATRGQTSKIVANAAGYMEEPSGQTFEDVPVAHTFYREIQRLASRNIMGGYPCGGTGEPCTTGKPYFRPQNNVTRGQSAKIVANTFFPDCETP